MALAIAGERSGVGKTTITLALLSYLKRSGITVQSFKVGPDYIDPMFHQDVTGRPCRNLDPLLTSPEYVRQCFQHHAGEVEVALIEGVMGLFDGIKLAANAPREVTDKATDRATERFSEKVAFNFADNSRVQETDYASTAHIARLLGVPVILVIDCSRLSGSVAAIAHGYRSLDPRIHLAGVILNRVASDRHLELLQNALAPLQIPILGVLRRQDNIAIPDRHLGLVPTAELAHLDELFDRLADIAAESFDWQRLLPLLRQQQKLPAPDKQKLPAPDPAPDNWGDIPSSASSCHHSLDRGGLIPSATLSKIKIAIARDTAFSFYYQDNLDILESLGAELVPWSPLKDSHLPEDIRGLYFGGGFPEVFGEQLSHNSSARDAVRSAIQSGLPVYAECGGLMYLAEQIVDFEGKSWPMVGVLPTTAEMGKRLTLGYRRATALQNSPLLAAGDTVYGHEFHRSQLTCEPASPLFQTWSYRAGAKPVAEGWHQTWSRDGLKSRRRALGQQTILHASYIHLHWGSRPDLPARFLQHCRDNYIKF